MGKYPSIACIIFMDMLDIYGYIEYPWISIGLLLLLATSIYDLSDPVCCCYSYYYSLYHYSCWRFIDRPYHVAVA